MTSPTTAEAASIRRALKVTGPDLLFALRWWWCWFLSFRTCWPLGVASGWSCSLFTQSSWRLAFQRLAAQPCLHGWFTVQANRMLAFQFRSAVKRYSKIGMRSLGNRMGRPALCIQAAVRLEGATVSVLLCVVRFQICAPDTWPCSSTSATVSEAPSFDFLCWPMHVESARNMEYAFIYSRDVNDGKGSDELFDGVERRACLLGFNSAKLSRCIISVRCSDNLCVAVSSEGNITPHGVFDSTWDLCGVKDMSVKRSTVGVQTSVVSVAITVLHRFLCVIGAGGCARCDAAAGASLRRPAATAYAGQCIVQEKFSHLTVCT